MKVIVQHEDEGSPELSSDLQLQNPLDKGTNVNVSVDSIVNRNQENEKSDNTTSCNVNMNEQHEYDSNLELDLSGNTELPLRAKGKKRPIEDVGAGVSTNITDGGAKATYARSLSSASATTRTQKFNPQKTGTEINSKRSQKIPRNSVDNSVVSSSSSSSYILNEMRSSQSLSNHDSNSMSSLGIKKDTRNRTMRTQFERRLKSKGLELRRMTGDGNCLFRAVSMQIYGDPEWHGEIRKHVVDYLNSERAYFSQFVLGDYDAYVNRMRQNGCYGSNPEIQAIVEVYNRTVEVYEWKPVEKLNSSSSSSSTTTAFPNTSSSSSSALARANRNREGSLEPMNTFQCSYTTNNPPIRLAYSNGNHYDAIVDPYEASIGVGLGLPGLRPGGIEKDMMKKAFNLSKKGLKNVDNMFVNKTKFISDQEATEIAMEEAAINASLRDFWQEQNTTLPSNSNSSMTRKEKMSTDNGENRRRVGNTNNGSSGSSSSSKRDENSSKLLNDFAAQRAKLSCSGHEYPSVVEELVVNGFPLEKVLSAHSIAGDNFDALLSLLLRST
mmetsp:Transcript_683/g.828  ORF Transcript_683/g.828 Transcript_683/m.828 type:complete len:553 (-) Transcript_683:945-2603(-)